MARVLVTGATGQAGQHVLEQLMVTGHDVRVLALPDSMHRVSFRDRIDLVPGHLSDPAALAEALDGVEILFHTALVAPPPVLTVERLADVNARGTEALVRAASGRIRRLVLMSSAVVCAPLDAPALWPMRDDALCMAHGSPPQVALAESLIAAEDAVQDAAEQGAFEQVTLRPTVIAGRVAPLIDHLVVSLLKGTADIDQLHHNWGVSQWVHGADLARAAILVAQVPEAANRTFLVAGDTPVTVHDIQSQLWDLMNSGAGRGGNPHAALAGQVNLGLRAYDAAGLRSLGWAPRMTMRDCLVEVLGRLEFHSSASLQLPSLLVDA